MFRYVPLPDELRPAPFILPKDRPLPQRLALLLMRRSEHAAIVTADLYKLECFASRPRVSDFKPLVETGWAKRDGDYHRLTEAGVRASDEVVHDFARSLGLHLKIVRNGAGTGTRFWHHMSCTCGRKFSHNRNEGHWASAQLRMWSKHLQEVEDAKAKGLVYVAPELTFAKRLEEMFAPPLQPEAS